MAQDVGNLPASHRASAFSAILIIGLIAGTLDITDSLVFNYFRGITPTMVFQYIATGLIGTRAVGLGLKSVALGVALHYTIAFTWTAIFYAASRKLAILTRRSVTCGLLYGAIVYIVMNFIVLPLSRVPHVHAAATLAARINAVAALLVCIGLPISLLLRRLAPPPRA
jgi:hypothetical protein